MDYNDSLADRDQPPVQQPHPVKSMAGRKSSSTTSTTTTFATSSPPGIADSSSSLVYVGDRLSPPAEVANPPTAAVTGTGVGTGIGAGTTGTLALDYYARHTPPASVTGSPLSTLTTNTSNPQTQLPSVLVSPLHYINPPPRSRPISPLSMIENTHVELVSAGPPSFNSHLIMPRISLPYKRPFTTTGLKLGELKILIAGGTGLGKSSLIDAVIKTCKDIVHVDCPQEWSSPKDFTSRKTNSNSYNEFDLSPPEPEDNPNDAFQPNTLTGKYREIYEESLQSSWDFIDKSSGDLSLSYNNKVNTPQSYSKEPYIEPENLAIYEQRASTKPLPSFLMQSNTIATASNISDSNSSNSSSSNSLYSNINYEKVPNLHANDADLQESSTRDYQGLNDGSFERNICFVDTAGYSSFKNPQNCISSTSAYLESQFKQTYSLLNFTNPKAISFILSSSTFKSFNHADVCFYLISEQLTSIDIQYMKRIDQFCPIIPLIAKSDTMKEKHINNLRREILQVLEKESIVPFMFENERNSVSSTSAPDAERTNAPSVKHPKRRKKSDVLSSSEDSGEEEEEEKGSNLVTEKEENQRKEKLDEFENKSKEGSRGRFKRQRNTSFNLNSALSTNYPPAISCRLSDEVEMVASILMDPSYEPPLYESDLAMLCTKVFSEEGASWLRYASAKKFIDWTHRKQVEQSLQVQQALRSRGTTNDWSFRAHNYNHNNTYSTFNPNAFTGNDDHHLHQEFSNNNKKSDPEYYVNLPEDLNLTMCSAYAFEQTAQWIFDLQTKSSNKASENNLLYCNHHQHCDMFCQYKNSASGNNNNLIYHPSERYTPAKNVDDQLDSPLPGVMIGPSYHHRNSNQRLNDNMKNRLHTGLKHPDSEINPTQGEVFFRNSNHDKVLVSKCMVNVDPLSLNEILLKMAKYALGTIGVVGIIGLIIKYWNSSKLFGQINPGGISTQIGTPSCDRSEHSALVRGFKLIFNKVKESTSIASDPEIDDEEWRKLFAWTMYYN